MKGLSYLLLTTIKNRLLSLRKKPALLVVYILCALSLIGMIILYTVTPLKNGNTHGYADIRILYSIVAALGLLFTYTFVNTGLSTGGTLFNMADVSLLFVSPISPTQILVYGLIKQLGTTILTSIFILFQVANIKNNFNVNGFGIFCIFIIYAAMLFFCQLVAIAIYVYTNGNNRRKSLIRYILYGIIAGIGLLVFLDFRQTGNLFESLLKVVDSRVFHMIPIAGWSTMFVKASISYDIFFLITGFGLYILGSVLIIIMITAGNADYYEDVLLSTETNYNKLQAAKEGKRPNLSKKVKVRQNLVGIGRGKGASVIFYKHMLESKRKSRLLFIDSYTVFTTLGAAAASYFIKESFVGYIILGVLVYILFFYTVLGKLSLELMKPYIFLIPAKSITKLIAASLSNILKPCVDSVIIFGVVCIISKTSPLQSLFLALAYIGSALIFISFTILSQRFLGGQLNKIVMAMFGIGLFFIVVAPGIIASIVTIILLPEAFGFIGTLPYTVWCVIVAALVFLLCGDLLDKTELASKVSE